MIMEATISNVSAAINDPSKDILTRRLLAVLTCPEIPVVPELIFMNDKMCGNGKCYDFPSTLAHLFENNKRPFETTVKPCTFKRNMIAILKREFGEDVTIRTIQSLYKNSPAVNTYDDTTSPYIKDFSKLIKVDLDDYKLDAKMKSILKDYDIYIEDDNKYPFMLIHIEPIDTYIAYNIYRFIGQLPWYVRLDDDYKLPTIDHINRDYTDNRCCNLRYCTILQNCMNKCRVKDNMAMYHNVSISDSLSIKPTSPFELDLLNKLRFWFTLASTYQVPSNYRQIYEEDHFDPRACKASLFPEDLKAFVNDVITELKRYIIDDRRMTYPTAPVTVNPASYVDVPCEARVLAKTLKAAGGSFKVASFIRPNHFGALAVDVFKLYTRGSFAHMNVLNAPVPQVTLSSVTQSLMTPDECLNAYECHHKNDYIEVPEGSTIVYEKKGGLICASYKMRPHIKIKSINLEFLDQSVDQRSYIITKPNCVYKYEKKALNE